MSLGRKWAVITIEDSKWNNNERKVLIYFSVCLSKKNNERKGSLNKIGKRIINALIFWLRLHFGVIRGNNEIKRGMIDPIPPGERKRRSMSMRIPWSSCAANWTDNKLNSIRDSTL